MRGIIVSKYTLIREGLCSIVSRYKDLEIKLVAETIEEAVNSIRENKIDIVFLTLHDDKEEELLQIKALKESGVTSRFLILDFKSDKELFIKAIKCGVEGYILGKSNEVEILHTLEQVSNGKKYFDAHFIDSMINKSNADPMEDEVDQLTAREKEILCQIGIGMSNRQISEKLYISEHTVKKHINHIFDKLNIKDRTQAALFANKCGIISINAS